MYHSRTRLSVTKLQAGFSRRVVKAKLPSLMFLLFPVVSVVVVSTVLLLFLFLVSLVASLFLYLLLVSMYVVLDQRRYVAEYKAESSRDLATEQETAAKEDTATEGETVVEADMEAEADMEVAPERLFLPMLFLPMF